MKTVKRLSCILILILITCYLTSCGQKLPVPTSDAAGMLVIPATSRNFTQYKYGYYYNFIYEPETQIQIKAVPLGSRKFVAIPGIPPGDYEISAIRSISSASGGSPQVSAETTEFSKPVAIQIRPNQITLLEYMFSVEQRLANPNDAIRYYQGYSFKPLNDSQYDQVVDDLKNLPNVELWNPTQLPARSTTNEKNGVTSVNQLYLTRPNWGRK